MSDVNWFTVDKEYNVLISAPGNESYSVFAFQDENGDVFNLPNGAKIEEFTVLSRRDMTSNITAKTLFKPEPVNHDGGEPPQGKFDYINWDVVPEHNNVLVECNLGRIYAVQHTNGTCLDGLTGVELKEYRILARRPGTQHETDGSTLWKQALPDGLLHVFDDISDIRNGDEPGISTVTVTVKASEGMKKIKSDDDFESYRELPDFLKKWLREQKEKLLNGTNKSGETPVGLLSYTDLSSVTSQDILAEAGKTQVSRGVTYDSPKGERSMGKTVAMFNIHTGFNLTEEQGWQFVELLKMVRSGQGEFKLDNYVDGASYASLAGESAARDRGNKL